MIRCAIIDDEPYARKLLEEFISKTPDLALAGSYSSPLKARELVNHKKIDAIFLDIQMPDITGIDFLKSAQYRPLVILTTAYAEYALKGFELDVVDYLLKPFDFNRFLKAVNKLSDRLKNNLPDNPSASKTKDFIFVKDGKKLVKIDLPSIAYIKGSREYVTIVTADNKKIMTLQSMKNLEQDLSTSFIRIHNSFIVNLKMISEIHKDEVVIKNETFPIGISYKKNFLSRIKEHTQE